VQTHSSRCSAPIRVRGTLALAVLVAAAFQVCSPGTCLAGPAATPKKAIEYGALGKDLALKGKFALSAKMFGEALALAPDDVNFMYSEARAHHLASHEELAAKGYRTFLAKASATHSMRARAGRYLKEVESLLKARAAADARKAAANVVTPAQVVPKPAASPAPPPPAAPATHATGSTRRTAGLVATTVGVVVAGYGGYQLIVDNEGLTTIDDDMDLERELGVYTPGSADYIQGAEEQAQSQREAIVGDLWVDGVVLGVGLACAGAGVWLLLTAPDAPAVSVLPVPGGGMSGSLSWRF